MKRLFRNSPFVILVPVIVILFLLEIGTSFITDLLWFNSVGYQSTFLIILFSDWGSRLAVWFFLFTVFFINLLLTLRVVKKFSSERVEYLDQNVVPIKEYLFDKFITLKRLIVLYTAASILMAFILSAISSNQWPTIQRFVNTVSFGITDPIFGKDISFYIFKLPFYQLLYSIIVVSVLGSAILVGAVYFLFTPRGTFNFRFNSFKQPQIHLTLLVALFFILKAWSYRLDAYELLMSSRGVAFGASYTDVHANLPAYNILAIISLLAALIMVVSIFIKMRKLVFGSIGLLIISSIVLGVVYPAVIEKFQVEPNQFAKEKKYLEYNIKFTKYAYNLHEIAEKDFAATKKIPPNIIEESSSTINNIRLWDWRPLKQTYNQLQGLRPYYNFKNIDIDRYKFDGNYHQVMIAARELEQNSLPLRAQTWQNIKLRYTHGYGLVMSPVNKVTPQGLPEFFIKDIPPKSSIQMKIVRPEIYFGELTDDYVIVNTKHQEFNYPSGDDNVYNNYDGKGGVKLDSIFKKALFAYKFKDFKILLSSDITKESRILFDRNINTMVEKIAPFLKYDRDPYLVLSEGKLYWIKDAYTISNRYPYSEPTRGWGNYIRNSVKVVIDAYEGNVNFYISAPNDPLIQSYKKIFPELFKPLDSMPNDLKQHIRYPVDLFYIQAQMYTNYHMTNPQVFYNKEDAWNIPEEIYIGESQPMTPYYTIMQIPGETEPEYVLMLPFTPAKKQNMVAWLAARNDKDKYGKLILFKFPKNKHVYGPAQIEARIDQDSEISQQLTLWDQRGSQVLRGNLLVIPIKDTILYVEPLFLQAEQSNLPELRRVIVGFGDDIVMEETLEAALEAIFGKEKPLTPVTPKPEGEKERELADLSIQVLIKEASQAFRDAQESAQAGNWAEYGRNLKKLQSILFKLEEKSTNNSLGGE